MDVEDEGRPRRRRTNARSSLHLSVEGYKAVRHPQELRMAPLTVIAGVNSSGKSSFMQPFLLMKQTLDSTFDPGPLLLYGANVKVTEHSQIFSRGKAKWDSVESFSVGLRRGNSSRRITFGLSPSGGLRIETDSMTLDNRTISIKEQLTQKQRDELLNSLATEIEEYHRILTRGEKEGKLATEVRRDRCFLEILATIEMKEYGKIELPMSASVRSDDWAALLRDIIHVPGLRGNPERSYTRSATGRTFPGTFETYVASLIYEWSEVDPDKLRQLATHLELLGLTWKVQARRLNDASIELLVGRTPHAQQGGAHDLVSVADVGFGVSQTLPVLVALLAARPGQIVYLEQPEIHLHPRAQLALSSVLIEAANRGVVVVAETHSSLIIRGIQTGIARGHLKPQSISMNWFDRDPVTGFQTVSVAEIDSMGRFGDWPVDFDDISRDADWDYLDAVEAGT